VGPRKATDGLVQLERILTCVLRLAAGRGTSTETEASWRDCTICGLGVNGRWEVIWNNTAID
jgi:hypothetical protein